MDGEGENGGERRGDGGKKVENGSKEEEHQYEKKGEQERGNQVPWRCKGRENYSVVTKLTQ